MDDRCDPMHCKVPYCNATYLLNLCFFMYRVAQFPQGRLPSHLVLRARHLSQLAQRATGGFLLLVGLAASPPPLVSSTSSLGLLLVELLLLLLADVVLLLVVVTEGALSSLLASPLALIVLYVVDCFATVERSCDR